MQKKIVLFSVIFFILFFTYQNWDVVFSESQHLFYSIYYARFSFNKSESSIEKRTIQSSFLKKSMRLNVYVPKGYYSDPKKKYTVLFLLHGYPGTENDWLINTALQARLDEKIKAGTLPSLLVIFPDMNGPIVRDSQYLDATKIDQKMESYFIKELVPYIDAQYQTIQLRANRAIGGLSSGGYGALYIGIKYNDLFSYIFSHSGYMTNNESVLSRLITDSKGQKKLYSPLYTIEKAKLQNPLFIYFDIGKDDDKNFVIDNNTFNEKLNSLNIPHVYSVTHGGHGWNVWGKNIDNSLKYLTHIYSKNK